MNKLYCILLFCMYCLAVLPQQTIHLSQDYTSMQKVADAEMGYYITKEGQIVRVRILQTGKVERSQKIIIPEQLEHEFALFTPEDIIGYGFDKDETKYISATVHYPGRDIKCFLKELINDNEISLYTHETQEGARFFFTKGDGVMTMITDGGGAFRNFLRERAQDCKVRSEIDSYRMKMNEYSLIKMYHAYTDCNINYFQKFRFGITAGFVCDKYHLQNDHEYTTNPAIAYNVGVFCLIPLDDKFTFHPEIVYSAEKVKGKTDNFRLPKENTYKRSSLQIPLLFRYTMNNLKGKNRPYFELGPYMDFRLSGDLYPVFVKGYSEESSVSYEVSTVLYGASFGIGLEHQLSLRHSLYIGMRYTPSVGGTKQEDKEIHNAFSFQLSVGF